MVNNRQHTKPGFTHRTPGTPLHFPKHRQTRRANPKKTYIKHKSQLLHQTKKTTKFPLTFLIRIPVDLSCSKERRFQTPPDKYLHQRGPAASTASAEPRPWQINEPHPTYNIPDKVTHFSEKNLYAGTYNAWCPAAACWRTHFSKKALSANLGSRLQYQSPKRGSVPQITNVTPGFFCRFVSISHKKSNRIFAMSTNDLGKMGCLNNFFEPTRPNLQ